MAWVYILESQKNKRFYIGSTVNLEERLKRHNSGYEKATKSYRPYSVIFKQECATVSQARILEYKIKKWKRRDFVLRIIASGVVY